MARLTFYGGVGEIGGNKILLEEGYRRLFLDFGFPYKRYKLFYEEYLKPRSGAGLADPLSMGLTPPLEGIYREDLQVADLWPKFRDLPLYRRLDHLDGVLLTHAHQDHSGHISFLKSDIPVYSTAVTAFIAKAMQDSGKSDFDRQVCYYSPVSPGCPPGLRQTALLASGEAKRQRRFCVADTGLSAEAARFWETVAGQRGLAACSLSDHSGCSFKLRCFPVDHSIPGACAWGVETGSGWVIYSGDLRQHGRRAELTKGFVEEAARLRPRALVLEGTNVGLKANVSEAQVYENGLKAISRAQGLVIADFSPRDVDRLLTFLQVARDTGRKLVITPRDAYLLKTVRLLEPEIPDIAAEESLLIYQETTASRSTAHWLRDIFAEFSSKIVLADDVGSAQDQFILCFSFFDLNELPSIHPKPGGLYIYSSSEPHDEEQEIDFRRLHHWLAHFGFRGFGLPVEGNGWRVPDDERGLHASGHACGPDLLEVALSIKPKILIPVHSESPSFYAESLGQSGINVTLPSPGGSVDL